MALRPVWLASSKRWLDGALADSAGTLPELAATVGANMCHALGTLCAECAFKGADIGDAVDAKARIAFLALVPHLECHESEWAPG